ncbi:ABC transporter ATP-binding protein [Niallia sp. Krafla_26]|uniref:ABC transporter ATP-binding protein n=1 Tax=Niallia sp. Krafla_26 TaxID=3064703 RepID=UPI003D17AB7B
MERNNGMDALLHVDSVSINFGGIKAIQNVSFQLQKGEILGLIGPNGAGKTTLFNLFTGIYTPTSGTITFNGEVINRMKPYVRVRKGIARTFQNIRLIKNLTVLENVLNAHPAVNTERFFTVLFPGKKTKAKRKQNVKDCIEVLKIVGMEDKLDVLAGNLPYGEQRLVEIARALVTGCQLLLLDEPAAGMNHVERQKLIEIIQTIAKQYEKTILIIEHDMRLVMNLAKNVVVLDHGEKIAEGPGEVIQHDEKVVRAYLGE